MGFRKRIKEDMAGWLYCVNMSDKLPKKPEIKYDELGLVQLLQLYITCTFEITRKRYLYYQTLFISGKESRDRVKIRGYSKPARFSWEPTENFGPFSGSAQITDLLTRRQHIVKFISRKINHIKQKIPVVDVIVN